MNCEIVKELSSQFLDNELQDEEVVQVLAHGEQCKDCRYFLRSMLQLRKDLLTLSVSSLSSDLDEKIMSQARLSAEGKRIQGDRVPIRSRQSFPQRIIDGAIAFILVLFFGVLFSSTVSSVESSSSDAVGLSQQTQ
ncbi:MAG: zf-HC2 domain-containing protein [bacterium]